MKRMTERDEFGVLNYLWERNCENGDFDILDEELLIKQIDRLAAYEDTGLEPENMAHWEEWFQAECDGRLVALPCKLGDTVWYITSTAEICEAEVTAIWLNIYTNPQMWLKITYYSKIIGKHEYKSRIDLMLGKTVFLTREEAEAALEAQKGGERNG